MFGLGIGEILIILAFALIFIGPKKLPELAKSLGKGLREFQRAKDEILHSMENDHHANNSSQQFNQGDHIDAEVTGVSEVDPYDYDDEYHHEHDDEDDDHHHNEEVDEHDTALASNENDGEKTEIEKTEPDDKTKNS